MGKRIQILEEMVDNLTQQVANYKEIKELQEKQIEGYKKMFEIHEQQIEKLKDLARTAVKIAKDRGEVIEKLTDMLKAKTTN